MAASFHVLFAGGEALVIPGMRRLSRGERRKKSRPVTMKMSMVRKGRSASGWLGMSALAVMLAVTGCGNKSAGTNEEEQSGTNRHGVPKAAQVVNSGRGNLAHFANASGMVYVVDESSGKVIYSGRMNAGDKLMIYVGSGRLAVNGAVAPGVDVNPEHAHRIYFLRG